MGADNKVIWSEGMFLRPQHFQQHDRYIEWLVRSRVGGITPFSFGITELKINQELLLSGKFAVVQCRGILPDGTPFDILADENPPTPLEIGANIRDEIIYLTLPEQQPGGKEVTANGADVLSARFGTSKYRSFDAIAGSDTTADLDIGKLKLHYALQSSERAGYVCLGIARVLEVRADKTVKLDEDFMPATLACAAVQKLASYITEIQGLLRQRGDGLAGKAVESAGGVGEIRNFLLLQISNRYEPLMLHYGKLPELHPVTLYSTILEMAGEFATFLPRRRPGEFPTYQHDDLKRCYPPLMDELRDVFKAVFIDAAEPIPLTDGGYGIKLGQLKNKRLLSEAGFVLAVAADTPAENVQRKFPGLTTIGPEEKIEELVNNQLKGIPLRLLPAAPRQIPFHRGTTYFELDTSTPLWAQLKTSGAFAFHVGDEGEELPGLVMEFWAIRR